MQLGNGHLAASRHDDRHVARALVPAQVLDQALGARQVAVDYHQVRLHRNRHHQGLLERRRQVPLVALAPDRGAVQVVGQWIRRADQDLGQGNGEPIPVVQ
jgi:hypothetical protein